MSGPWEDYKSEGPWNDYTPGAKAVKAEPKAQGFFQGMTTNQPTQGFMAAAGRAALPTVGGMIGAAGGMGWASVPGAAAGGSAGEGVRQTLVSAMNPSQPRDLGEVTGQVALQAFGVGAGKALASAPVRKLGAQALQAINATPLKYAEPLLKAGASGIARAKQLAGGLADQSYQAFEKYTGMEGLRPLITKGAKYFDGKIVDAAFEGGKPLESAGSEMVKDVALRVAKGESVDKQTLYVASQMANNLRNTNPFAPEAQKLMSGSMTQWKNVIEGALEKTLPEYKNLRADRWLAAAGERVGSWLPLNKDTSVNALRSYGALQTGLGAAGALVGAGHDRSLSGAEHGAMVGVGLGALATSPKLAFGAIQAGSRAAQSGITQMATKAIGSLSVDEIMQYLRGQGANPTP